MNKYVHNESLPGMFSCYLCYVINFTNTGFLCVLNRIRDESIRRHDWSIYSADSMTQRHSGETRNFMVPNGVAQKSTLFRVIAVTARKLVFIFQWRPKIN
jgi:hypothetical protein